MGIYKEKGEKIHIEVIKNVFNKSQQKNPKLKYSTSGYIGGQNAKQTKQEKNFLAPYCS